MKNTRNNMTNSDISKKAMLEALEKSLGVVTSACRAVDISRETHYRWMRQDADYKQAVDDLSNVALDFAESQLHQQIKKGVPTSTIFYLKTKGKRRGYVERQEIAHEGLKTFEIEEVDEQDPS
jgi:transposase-like protein